MRRDQTAHERLIPILVQLLGCRTYLEFGSHLNETIGKVKCERRYGVDVQAMTCEGAEMFTMSTQEFVERHARRLAPFDFVFIDAEHSQRSVRTDFIGIFPFVSPEGIVALHDTNPETMEDTSPGYCGDAWKYALSLWRTGLESLTLPYHPGLSLVRKRVTWGPRT